MLLGLCPGLNLFRDIRPSSTFIFLQQQKYAIPVIAINPPNKIARIIKNVPISVSYCVDYLITNMLTELLLCNKLGTSVIKFYRVITYVIYIFKKK